MNVYVDNDRTITSDFTIIGKTLENEASIIRFNLTKEMATKEFYIEFKKPSGETVSTPRLDITIEDNPIFRNISSRSICLFDS